MKKKNDKPKTIYVVYEEGGYHWRTPVEAINKREAKKKILAKHPSAKHIQFF